MSATEEIEDFNAEFDIDALVNAANMVDGNPVVITDRLVYDLTRKDIKEAASSLRAEEARFLVDFYYSMQEYRIRTTEQVRAAEHLGEPNALLTFLQERNSWSEATIQRALDIYTSTLPIGVWLKSQYGIGPVIAAGLISHININNAPTAGHIHSFAGITPTAKWLSREEAEALVKKSYVADDLPTTIANLAIATGRREQTLWNMIERVKNMKEEAVDVWKPTEKDLAAISEEVEALVKKNSLNDLPTAIDSIARGIIGREQTLIVERMKTMKGEVVDSAKWLNLEEAKALVEQNYIVDDLPTTIANLAQAIIEREQALMVERMKTMKGGSGATWKPTEKNIAAIIARRPWNAKLKVLAWKIGCSMGKFYKRDACFYGHIYASRKAMEIQKNEAGEYKKVAEEMLAKRTRPGKDTIAYQHYIKGVLPPGHIDARARRYCVKIFLSHMQMVWWFIEHGSLPVAPYAMAHVGHAHFIWPPNTHIVPGLTEALEAQYGKPV